MSRHLILYLVITLIISGCATFQPSATVDEPPSVVTPTPFDTDRVPVALVLSGGSARGYAHIGVIKVLEAHGLRPDIVVGTSAGSIVGALYASGLSAAELEQTIEQLDSSVFSDLVIPGLGFLPGEKGFVRGEKLHRFIDDRSMRHHIQDFPIRFAAIATELSTGKPVAFNAGDVGLAVLASSAVPGLITPVQIGRSEYSDGQIASPLPVATARTLGARIVIAVDVMYPPEDAFVYSAIGVLFQTFTVSAYRIKEFEKAGADVVVTPAIAKTTGQFTFADRQHLINAGVDAAMQMLPAIRAALVMGGVQK